MSTLTEMFQYLDELRESGETNMFGAASYLQSKFVIDRKAARTVLKAWMQAKGGTKGGIDERIQD